MYKLNEILISCAILLNSKLNFFPIRFFILKYTLRHFLIAHICFDVNILYFSIFQKKLDGYKFPVYTTAFCPRIKTEWTERSSALNCNKSNGYMCLPNDRFDELLEFCYREPVERIQKGKNFSLVFKENANFSFVY